MVASRGSNAPAAKLILLVFQCFPASPFVSPSDRQFLKTTAEIALSARLLGQTQPLNPLMQTLVRRMNLTQLLQSQLQPLVQQHQRSERIAQIAVTSGYDLIDCQLVFIKSRYGAFSWHTNNIQTET